MDELRTPTVTFDAEVVCADGRTFPGQLFAPVSAPRHSGAARASEVLNDAAEFFPFLPQNAPLPVMFNKREVRFISVPASANAPDEALTEVGNEARRVELECGEHRLSGSVLIDMPAGQRRVLDYLNRPEKFLTLRTGERHYLVRKESIVRVIERDDS